MLVYIPSQEHRELFSDYCNQNSVPFGLHETQNLHSFVESSISNLSHVTVLAFDLSALEDTDNEILTAIRLLRSMYDRVRIVVVALERQAGDPLLDQIVGLGVANIITDRTAENVQKAVERCLLGDGIPPGESLQVYGITTAPAPVEYRPHTIRAGQGGAAPRASPMERPQDSRFVPETSVPWHQVHTQQDMRAEIPRPINRSEPGGYEEGPPPISPLPQYPEIPRPTYRPDPIPRVVADNAYIPPPTSFAESYTPRSYAPEVYQAPRPRRAINIGICGTQRRMGTTHQGIMLCAYLNSIGYRAAYMEHNAHQSIQAMDKRFQINSNPRIGLRQYAGIDLYSGYSLPVVMALKYDFYVFDYGTYQETSVKEFLSNDVKILVGGSKAWELPYYLSLFEAMDGYTDLRFIINFSPEEEHHTIVQLMDIYGNKTVFSGYAADPFTSGENDEIFYALLQPFLESGVNPF